LAIMDGLRGPCRAARGLLLLLLPAAVATSGLGAH